jgi:hypothetical protein
VDAGREGHFGSRLITISDLLDVKAELAKIFDRSTIHRLRYRGDGLGDEIEDLFNAADSEYRGLEAIGWAGDHHQALKLQVGADVDPWLSVNESADVRDPAVLTTAKKRVAEMIISSGRRTLSRDNQLALLRIGTLLVFLGLVAWLAIVVWPNAPAVLVALMAAVAFQRAIVDRQLERIVGRNFRNGQNHHVVVRYISRHDQREQKARRRFGLLTFVAGAAVTALVTVIATYGGEWLARLSR